MDFSAENILGWITMCFALMIVFLGMPRQVVKHVREKWCGINFLWLLLSIGVQASRIAYLVIKKAYYPIIPDSLGLLILLVFLYQWAKYNWGQTAPVK